MITNYDERLHAPLAEILLSKVAAGVARGRAPEGRRGSVPAASLDALDALREFAPTLLEASGVEPEGSAAP
jgi:hypothetical protein